jgi:S1-C subfamily serine protease
MRPLFLLGLLAFTCTVHPSFSETPKIRQPPVADIVTKRKPAIVVVWGNKKTPDDKEKHVPLGVGAIVDPAGIIVAPRHVADGSDGLEAVLADGRNLKAMVLLSDSATGLAIIQVASTRPLPHAELADSSRVKLADTVVGLGKNYGELSVGIGIISATDRMVKGRKDKLLQTDTCIGPGFVSDILLNLDGKIVGVGVRLGNRGINFAIPSNRVKEILAQLVKKK